MKIKKMIAVITVFILGLSFSSAARAQDISAIPAKATNISYAVVARDEDSIDVTTSSKDAYFENDLENRLVIVKDANGNVIDSINMLPNIDGQSMVVLVTSPKVIKIQHLSSFINFRKKGKPVKKRNTKRKTCGIEPCHPVNLGPAFHAAKCLANLGANGAMRSLWGFVKSLYEDCVK